MNHPPDTLADTDALSSVEALLEVLRILVTADHAVVLVSRGGRFVPSHARAPTAPLAATELAAEAAATGAPIRVADLMLETRGNPMLALAALSEPVTAIAVPMQAGPGPESPATVLYVQRPLSRHPAFTDVDLQRVQMVASIASSLIENEARAREARWATAVQTQLAHLIPASIVERVKAGTVDRRVTGTISRVFRLHAAQSPFLGNERLTAVLDAAATLRPAEQIALAGRLLERSIDADLLELEAFLAAAFADPPAARSAVPSPSPAPSMPSPSSSPSPSPAMPPPVSPAPAAPPSVPSTTDDPGPLLDDRYRLGACLARDASSELYLASHAKVSGRRYAILIVSPELAAWAHDATRRLSILSRQPDQRVAIEDFFGLPDGRRAIVMGLADDHVTLEQIRAFLAS